MSSRVLWITAGIGWRLTSASTYRYQPTAPTAVENMVAVRQKRPRRKHWSTTQQKPPHGGTSAGRMCGAAIPNLTLIVSQIFMLNLYGLEVLICLDTGCFDG